MKNALVILVSILLSSCSVKEKKEIPQYSIRQLYKNIEISGGTISPDDRDILISNNSTGIFNVFEISVEDGSWRQVTNSTTESCFAIDYVKGTGQILYSADKGGNENNHIYLLDKDNSVTDLTPGDEVKAIFSGWSGDRKTMYFQSNKRDPQYFDLYKMEVGDWKEELVYKNTEGFDFAGSTRDRSIIALVKSITTSESKLFIYDSVSEKITEVSEPDRPGAYNGAGFSSDNRFFIISPMRKEFAYLSLRDIYRKKADCI